MLEDLLAERVRDVQEQASRHDTDNFMNRLAAKITEDAGRPARIRYAGPGSVSGPGGETEPGDEPSTVAQVAPPAQTPDPTFTRPRGSSRPLPRPCTRRRRPTPIIPDDPAVSQVAVIAYVQQLCDNVLRSNDIDTLTDFAVRYDQAGARTFACLLYTLDKRDSALYWWRFAAGAGDPLAAHLLAAHHAAVGRIPDARIWRTYAHMLGFTSDRHLPQPVRQRTEIADGFGRELPLLKGEMGEFIRSPYLPQELAAR
ncbi:hypothetical protein OHA79_52565 (plasmid) [Streptomyces sp. NBC_00841]|uniref:hypothetical protein n=1 Tax=Streptomyces sp. NBC_00841 TaxID=2975847 RepID=UPI002DDA78E0|nr:hypothetical protein [Streptomyces sp. NBC_00841]WSA06106.1 hypothetical protein OHA79_52565 [Streptomyces sp. NBC_00841]